MKRVAMVLTAASLLAPLACADDVPRFGISEKSFRQAGACDNPYKELTAAAMLRRPDGKEWLMPLFWDGKSAWTLRVSPDVAGDWSYCLADPGRTYVFYVVGSRGAEPKLADGNYWLSRYDPRTGRSTELPASAGGPARLAASDAQDWVFLVKAK
jgi:hypothetical protein